MIIVEWLNLKIMNKWMDIIRKSNGKSSTIIIDDQVRKEIKSVKKRYEELLKTDDEIRDIDKISISVILNELDEFDQNILIAFFTIANSSPSLLAKMFGVSPSVITSRVNKIIKNVRNKSIDVASNRGIHC